MSAPAAATTSHGEGSVEQDRTSLPPSPELPWRPAVELIALFAPSPPPSGSTDHQAPAAEEQPERFEEGKDNSHSVLDKTDERSIKNQLAAAHAAEKAEKARDEAPPPMPTAAAKAHGNEPSRGAKVCTARSL